MTQKQFTVLSIEDNKADFDLLKEALHSIPGIDIDLINLSSGEASINFLLKNPPYCDMKTPDIVIIDINLPDMSGLEILSLIKSDDRIKHMPVIILSTSDLPSDIMRSYHLSANSYITKSFEISELFDKISTVAKYWFKTAEIPGKPNMYIFYKEEEENLKNNDQEGII